MDNQFVVTNVKFYNIPLLLKVEKILFDCGRNMAEKEGLSHWNNSHLKNLVIVGLCIIKNSVFLVFDGDMALATFQTKKVGNKLRFQKLATAPEAAGKGIGSYCMKHIERQAVEYGCTVVCCEVYDKSTHAIEFYKHRGYTMIGKTDTLKYSELLMEKTL